MKEGNTFWQVFQILFPEKVSILNKDLSTPDN